MFNKRSILKTVMKYHLQFSNAPHNFIHLLLSCLPPRENTLKQQYFKRCLNIYDPIGTACGVVIRSMKLAIRTVLEKCAKCGQQANIISYRYIPRSIIYDLKRIIMRYMRINEWTRFGPLNDGTIRVVVGSSEY